MHTHRHTHNLRAEGTETQINSTPKLPNSNQQGGEEDDVIIGQGGDDVLSGNDGDDMIIGDSADVTCKLGADLPQIISAFVIVAVDSAVPLADFQLNSVVVRPALIWPTAMYKYAPVQLTSFLANQVAQSPEQPYLLRSIDARDLNVNVSSRKIGLRAMFAMVPDLIHHVALLPGNDVLEGGGGKDVLVGDHLTILEPFDIPDGSAGIPLQQAKTNVSNIFASLMLRLPTISVDVDTVEQGLLNVTRNATIKTGNDKLYPVTGSDITFGDYAVLLVPVTSDKLKTNFAASTLKAMNDFYLDTYELAVNLDYVLFNAHTRLINKMFEGENERTIRSQAYLLGVRYVVIMGKDVFNATLTDANSTGLVVGDHAAFAARVQPSIVQPSGEVMQTKICCNPISCF